MKYKLKQGHVIRIGDDSKIEIVEVRGLVVTVVVRAVEDVELDKPKPIGNTDTLRS